jgi:hypothetical protein
LSGRLKKPMRRTAAPSLSSTEPRGALPITEFPSSASQPVFKPNQAVNAGRPFFALNGDPSTAICLIRGASALGRRGDGVRIEAAPGLYAISRGSP